jgi:hypothetical protein
MAGKVMKLNSVKVRIQYVILNKKILFEVTIMIKKLSLLLLVAMLAVVAVACGSDKEKEESSAKKENAKSEEITVKHQLGETKVKTNPE